MTEFEFRPRFRFRTPLAPDEVKRRIVAHARGDHPLRLSVGGTGHHVVLHYPQDGRHAWTPQMDIDIEAVDAGSRVRCLIGPAPSIWMLFTGGYLFCAMISLLGLSIGVSQSIVGADTWGYYMVVPAPFIAVALWLLAQEGRRRSRREQERMKYFVDEALGCDCFRLAEEH